jgi:DNA damage-binding protein 1
VLHALSCYNIDELPLTSTPIGSIAESKDANFQPKQLFFSSTGRIGILSIIEDTQLALSLTGLQRNMASVLPGIGGLKHTR